MNNRKAKKMIYTKGCMLVPYRESLLIMSKMVFSDIPKFRHVNYVKAYVKAH